MLDIAEYFRDEAKNKKIEELTARVAWLEAQLHEANRTIELYRNQARTNYQDAYDHVPYHDYDR